MMEGFIGALVGGFLAFAGSVCGARYTMNRMIALDSERRAAERAETQQTLANQLLAEIKDNLAILEQPKLQRRFSGLVHDIWGMAKGRLSFAQEQSGEPIRAAYTRVYWYNSMVAAACVDGGVMEQEMTHSMSIELRAQAAKQALQRAAGALEGEAGRSSNA